MLDIEREFQVEDVRESTNESLVAHGRCCAGPIKIGDSFNFIYQRRCLEHGENYREFDGDKFALHAIVKKVFYARKEVDSLDRGDGGALHLLLEKQGELPIKPKTVLTS